MKTQQCFKTAVFVLVSLLLLANCNVAEWDDTILGQDGQTNSGNDENSSGNTADSNGENAATTDDSNAPTVVGLPDSSKANDRSYLGAFSQNECTPASCDELLPHLVRAYTFDGGIDFENIDGTLVWSAEAGNNDGEFTFEANISGLAAANKTLTCGCQYEVNYVTEPTAGGIACNCELQGSDDGYWLTYDQMGKLDSGEGYGESDIDDVLALDLSKVNNGIGMPGSLGIDFMGNALAIESPDAEITTAGILYPDETFDFRIGVSGQTNDPESSSCLCQFSDDYYECRLFVYGYTLDSEDNKYNLTGDKHIDCHCERDGGDLYWCAGYGK